MPGPHDFAVRFSAVRLRAFADRSQAHHLPCDPVSRATLPRPPHPALHVRDDRDTPLFGRGGMARTNHRFRKNRSDLFLPRHLDSRISVELLRKIRFCAHAILSALRGERARSTSQTIQVIRPTTGKSAPMSRNEVPAVDYGTCSRRGAGGRGADRSVGGGAAGGGGATARGSAWRGT
jgi:hypothetical protein